MEHLFELTAEGEREIQLNLSLPDLRAFGPEVHFEEHPVNRGVVPDFQVAIGNEGNRRRQRFAEIRPSLARDFRRQRLESRLDENRVYRLLMHEERTARDHPIRFPGKENV